MFLDSPPFLPYNHPMSKIVLPHFHIGTSFGGNQSWFIDPMMHLGGCGAATACDVSIVLARDFGLSRAYPFNAQSLTRRDYVHFAMMMKPYLRPRWSGINTLEIYMDGFRNYLEDCGINNVIMSGLSGHAPLSDAAALVRRQIDAVLPVPMLILMHQAPQLKDFVWHWFLLTGYDLPDAVDTADDAVDGAAPTSDMLVQTATYGESQWFPLSLLWDTGSPERGGLVELHLQTE